MINSTIKTKRLFLTTLDGEYCKVVTRDNKVYSGTILSTSNAAHVLVSAKLPFPLIDLTIKPNVSTWAEVATTLEESLPLINTSIVPLLWTL